jgi:hypothetical protein
VLHFGRGQRGGSAGGYDFALNLIVAQSGHDAQGRQPEKLGVAPSGLARKLTQPQAEF